ncbi:DMT family transporter [Enterovirga rhinocerotis]|uniref:EamA domain-containing membrane protein RarD n=1 Tax=Enterovirga rhinocerotis TaxID=1339210 RepID=A0A4R7BUT7_9HYPH|nr:DMT family transporter [Enterovirga rhinocerotis]TDR89578.1 EamA domain-containing membrane protein RarD [Enterovirga rhinocerotis]
MGALAGILAALTGRPYLLLSLATIGWAGNAVAGRLSVGHMSPMVIVSLRWLVVMLLLGTLASRALRAEWPIIARHWRYLFCMGGLGYTIFNAIFYWAAHHTSAVNMGVLQGVTPVLVMTFAFVAYRTRIGLPQAVGVVVTLVGVAVVASRGSLEVLRTMAFNIGDLGIIAGSVLYAGYTVALRQRPALSPIAFFTAMASAAFVTSIPLVGLEMARGDALFPDLRGWALMIYIALLPSLLCQLAFMRAVQLIGPNRAGLFMNLVPVVAALLGVLLLGEHFGLYHAAGLALVLGGIWLAERKPAGV